MRKRTLLLLLFTGLSFIVALLLLFSGPRMRFQPSVQAFEEIMPYPPEDAVEFYRAQFDTVNLAFPAASTENLEKGWTYFTYYCSFCHGYDGRGNGEVGKSYMPKPADLSSAKVRNYTNGKLYLATFNGTGHSPVLERVVPYDHRPYILLFIRSEFK